MATYALVYIDDLILTGAPAFSKPNFVILISNQNSKYRIGLLLHMKLAEAKPISSLIQSGSRFLQMMAGPHLY